MFAIGLPKPSPYSVAMSALTTPPAPPGAGGEALPGRAAIVRAAAGIAVYAGVFGLAFGAVATAAGLSALQTAALSAIMFTGASQFALVGILAVAGPPFAALVAALLLGLRNAFYGVSIAGVVRPRGLGRLLTAHFVIDETTAMAVAQPDPRAGRYAFWATGISLFGMWNLGTLAGVLIGGSVNTSALGLDAAAPAIFLALLWPQLSRRRGPAVAIAAVVLSLALVTITPSGVPVIAAAVVAIAAGLIPERSPQPEEPKP